MNSEANNQSENSTPTNEELNNLVTASQKVMAHAWMVRTFIKHSDEVEDFPEIDYLLISHDHYDHLDYKTVKKLKPKVKQIITGLGVGSHFEAWGYKSEIITGLLLPK